MDMEPQVGDQETFNGVGTLWVDRGFLMWN
jgi:hypothetical protein